MKRRDVMKLGAVAAGAGVGMPGCAVPKLVSSMSGPDGAAQFNAMLDGQLAGMGKPGLLHRLAGIDAGKPRSADVAAKLAEQDERFRRMLGTLLVTQGFRELPAETQLDPAVQERMWRHMDEIGETVFEVSDSLASLDDAQRARLRTELDRRRDLPMELGEMLDAQAASAGISGARRMQLRKMMSQSAFRLRNGDPSSIIDEYTAKVERVRASSASHGDALHLAKQLGEQAFWKYQHLLAAQGQAPMAPPPPISAGPVPPPATSSDPPGMQQPARPPPPAMQVPERRKKPGSGGLRVGGYMLGIGLVVFGASALLVGASEAFLVGMTVGALLFAIGLITALVSAIMMATAGE